MGGSHLTVHTDVIEAIVEGSKWAVPAALPSSNTITELCFARHDASNHHISIQFTGYGTTSTATTEH